ncbi:O-phosphoserine--tRNA(Cys) ligase [Candidatus Methanoperedenaceae archaeon GB37]|nr:O-phosphoserine--tRNA(Cys) ligase [Candidatus Methanoperedenaceae archaeon GB37]
MKFDPDDFRVGDGLDLGVLWRRGRSVLSRRSINRRYPRNSPLFGKPHPVFDTVHRLREAYLRLGFDEMVNPVIVDEEDVRRQFGDEALAVLDRCFYLAGLPRPDVGISDERASMVMELLGIDKAGVEEIQGVLHSYKKGEVGGDDLVAEISHRLNVPDSDVAVMLDRVFPEFKDLQPESTERTLRSHMTTGWFITLSALLEHAPMPLRLFSVDRCFRREQEEDAARLMAYHSASCVIMDEDVIVDDGMAVAEGLLSQFGFEDFKFMPDEKRSKYYIPDTQIEVFAYHPKLLGSSGKYSDGWVEIATFGIYSPTALAEYNIPYPVMNLGLGVERLAMILHNAHDVRALTYPQFPQYRSSWEISDHELARMIRVEDEPVTDTGLEIAEAIVKTCEAHRDEPSPCNFTAWEGELFNRGIVVSVVEPEEGTRLCGPAAMNTVVVHKGNIIGVPPREKRLIEEGVSTKIRYIDAFAAMAASEIEKGLCNGLDEVTHRVRIVKTPGEVNLKIDPVAQRYITSHKKKIDIRGPIFTTVQMNVE